MVLGYYYWQISSFTVLNSVNIKRESQMLVGQWIVLSLVMVTLKFFIKP